MPDVRCHEHPRPGWDHVTYGNFSTALAAGKLLGLDADRLEQAVNLAGVNAAAVRQTRVGQLSHWKGCAFANAARNGVFARVLASLRNDGPERDLRGTIGLLPAGLRPSLELEVEDRGAPR